MSDRVMLKYQGEEVRLLLSEDDSKSVRFLLIMMFLYDRCKLCNCMYMIPEDLEGVVCIGHQAQTICQSCWKVEVGKLSHD